MEDKHTEWNEDQYAFDTRRLCVTAAEEDDPDYEGEYHAVPPPRMARLEAREGVVPSAGGRADARPEVACLVKGCHADLTTSKAYYRRFRICEAHMKSMSLSIEGRSCRFCQQCGKFHLVEEFDGANRNCRKALMIRFYKRRNMPLGGMQASLERNDPAAGMGDPVEVRVEPRKRGRPRAPRPNITEDDPGAAALAAGGGLPPPGLVGSNAAARAAAAAGFDSGLQAAYIAASRGYQGSSGVGVTPATAIGPPGYSQGGVRMAGIQVQSGNYDNNNNNDGDDDSDAAPPRQRRSKGASAARRASPGSSGAAGSGGLDLNGGQQLDGLNALGGGLPPLGDGLSGAGLGAGSFDVLGGGGPLEGLPGLPGRTHGGGLGWRSGALGSAGHQVGGLGLVDGGLGLGGGGGLRLGDLGLPLPLPGIGGGRGGGAGLGALSGLGLRGGGLLDAAGHGVGGAGAGGLLLDALGGAGRLLAQAGQPMRLVLQPQLDGSRRGGGSGNQSVGCSSSHSQHEQLQDDSSGLVGPLSRAAGATRGVGLVGQQQQQGATSRDAAAEALAALAASGQLDVQMLLAAVAASGGTASEQQAVLVALLAKLPGGAELLGSAGLQPRQEQDLEAGNPERPLPAGLQRLAGRDGLGGGRAGLLPLALAQDHEGVGNLGMGRLSNGTGGGGGRPLPALDVSGAVRPLGGGLGGLGRGRSVGLDMGAVGAAAAAGGGSGGSGRPAVTPLGTGLLGTARGRNANPDMDFPLRLDDGLPATLVGIGRLAAPGAGDGAGPLAEDDVCAGGGGMGELSLADLLGQMSIPQQLELLMGLPQQQMTEVLKQLPHTQQVELLLALQEDRQNRVMAERQQQQQQQQQPQQQQQQQQQRQQQRQIGAGGPQPQVLMLGAQGLRAAEIGGSGGGLGPRALKLDPEDVPGRVGLLESLAAGARLNLAPLGRAAGARGGALEGTEDEKAGLTRLQHQVSGKGFGAAHAAAQSLAAGTAYAAAGEASNMQTTPGRLQPPPDGADRRGNSGEAVKLEVPERAAKAFNSAKASSSPGNTASGATEQQQRQPAVKQQEEEQPQSEGNNAAGEASGRGGDRDGGNTGGAALDGCGDAAAAANTAEVAAAGDAADVADAAHDAAYSCEEALERLSLKLHGVRPDELAPDVAQRMHKWLESMDAVTLQGTLRSGCVNLVFDVSYRQPPAATDAATRSTLTTSDAAGHRRAWAYRLAAAAIASSLGLELPAPFAAGGGRQRGDEATEGGQWCGLCLQAAALAAARGIRVQVQVGNAVVYPPHAKQTPLAEQQQPATAEVHELAPLAIVQGDHHAVAIMSGRGLNDPSARLHVRLNGRRLGALVQPQQEQQLPPTDADSKTGAVCSAAAGNYPMQGPSAQEQEQQRCGEECALVFLDAPGQAGLAVLEWEAGGGAGVLGDWWPLVVAPDAQVAAEVNALALNSDIASGRGTEWLRRLLVDVGLVIDAAHNSPAGGLHAGLEPGVLERLVCRARCVVPFCEARMMPHTAAVARAFLAAAAAETETEADAGIAAVSKLPSRASWSLSSSACGSDFDYSDSEQKQEDHMDSSAGDATSPGTGQCSRSGVCKCPDSPCAGCFCYNTDGVKLECCPPRPGIAETGSAHAR